MDMHTIPCYRLQTVITITINIHLQTPISHHLKQPYSCSYPYIMISSSAWTSHTQHNEGIYRLMAAQTLIWIIPACLVNHTNAGFLILFIVILAWRRKYNSLSTCLCCSYINFHHRTISTVKHVIGSVFRKFVLVISNSNIVPRQVNCIP